MKITKKESKIVTTMRVLNRNTLLPLLTLFAAGACMTAEAGAGSHFFYDDFERDDGSDIGPGWEPHSGNWSLSGNTVRLTSGGDYHRADYTPFETGGQPYVVQSDFSGNGDSRWPGIVFNIDPDNPGNFYAFIMRVEGGSGQSAAQFRRYTDWSRDGGIVVSEFTPEELQRNEFYRYRVVSPEPGIFDLTILRLDQDTREPLYVVWEKRVEDDTHSWGGQTGLYGNDLIHWDNFLVASHADPAQPVDLRIRDATEIEFLAEQDRFYQPQVFDGEDWTDYGSLILGKGEVVSIRVPAEAPEMVRIVTGAE